MGWFGDLFKPATELIDDLNTSDEERLQLRNEFADIQEKGQGKIIELEKAVVEALSKVQVAEAQSEHFLVYAWRPISILVLLTIIVLGIFNLVTMDAGQLDSIVDLFKMVFGVYGGSRGLEKIAKVVKFGK